MAYRAYSDWHGMCYARRGFCIVLYMPHTTLIAAQGLTGALDALKAAMRQRHAATAICK